MPAADGLRPEAGRILRAASELDAHARRLAALGATLADAFTEVAAGARGQAARATAAIDAAQSLLHETDVAADDMHLADADAIAAGVDAAAQAARAALARILAPDAGPEATADAATLILEALDHLGDLAQASRSARQALGDLAAGSETQRMGAQTIVRCVDEVAIASARTVASAARAQEPLRDVARLAVSLAEQARSLALEARALAEGAEAGAARSAAGRAAP